MSLSCSADVTEHGFCQRLTMVCQNVLCWKCCGCNDENRSTTQARRHTDGRRRSRCRSRCPSFDIAVTLVWLVQIDAWGRGPLMIPIECRLAGQASGSDYLLVGAPSLHSTS